MPKDSEIELVKPFAKMDSEIHGQRHWSHVRRLGLELGNLLNLTDEQLRCIELFALTHDLARTNDGKNTVHSDDGSYLFVDVAKEVFPLLDGEQRGLIQICIKHHSDGITAEEAYLNQSFRHIAWREDDIINTVGCCWDADRLDLLRLGIEPNGKYMSTSVWEDVLPLARKLNGVEF
jgi:uncharacterized protein